MILPLLLKPILHSLLLLGPTDPNCPEQVVSTSETETEKIARETETLIHEYSRLKPRLGKCVFSRPRPGKWSRPRVSLISGPTLHLDIFN